MTIETWQLLHDGSIVDAVGTVPGDIALKVEIQYLHELLSSGADHLWVYLQNCVCLEYLPFDVSEPIREPSLFRTLTPEILEAEEKSGCLQVTCVCGILKLDYANSRCELMDGTAIRVTQLKSASHRYWENLEIQ